MRDDPFRVNFLRLKTQQQLYVREDERRDLPHADAVPRRDPAAGRAPIGNYDVDVKVFARWRMLARVNSAFEVVKVGFEQFVANAARDYGLLYGLATAMMALHDRLVRQRGVPAGLIIPGGSRPFALSTAVAAAEVRNVNSAATASGSLLVAATRRPRTRMTI